MYGVMIKSQADPEEDDDVVDPLGADGAGGNASSAPPSRQASVLAPHRPSLLGGDFVAEGGATVEWVVRESNGGDGDLASGGGGALGDGGKRHQPRVFSFRGQRGAVGSMSGV